MMLLSRMVLLLGVVQWVACGGSDETDNRSGGGGDAGTREVDASIGSNPQCLASGSGGFACTLSGDITGAVDDGNEVSCRFNGLPGRLGGPANVMLAFETSRPDSTTGRLNWTISVNGAGEGETGVGLPTSVTLAYEGATMPLLAQNCTTDIKTHDIEDDSSTELIYRIGATTTCPTPLQSLVGGASVMVTDLQYTAGGRWLDGPTPPLR